MRLCGAGLCRIWRFRIRCVMNRRRSNLVFEDRAHEGFKVIFSPQRVRNPDPSADGGENGKDHQRGEHRPRALVDASVTVRVILRRVVIVSRTMCCGVGWIMADWYAALTEEGHEPQPEHVKGGHEGGDDTDQPQNDV